MKQFLAVAVFILLSSTSAHAQRMSGTPVTEGGEIGGGSHPLPIYANHSFDVSYVSGSDYDFNPSTFLSYDQAVNDGKAVLGAHVKTLAEMAKESRNSDRAKAKINIVEDPDTGKLALESR
jgi:hypothetical protein